MEELKKFASGSGGTTTPTPADKPDIADLKTRVNKAIDEWAKTL
jgi:hypothetical protein